MSVSFEHLRKATVSMGDDTTGKITDLWIKKDAGTVSHAQIDLGGWFQPDEILVQVSHLSREHTDDAWALTMTQAQIDQAPRWPDMAHAAMVDWPPLIIGPFGSTLSLPLIGAQVRARNSDDANTSASKVTQSMERASALLGQPVFTRDGEIGTVVGLWIDPATWALQQYDVAPSHASDTMKIPASALKHRGQKDGHLVIKGVQADYTDAHRQAS